MAGWYGPPTRLEEESSSSFQDNWPFGSTETTCAHRFTMLLVQWSPRTIYG